MKYFIITSQENMSWELQNDISIIRPVNIQIEEIILLKNSRKRKIHPEQRIKSQL